MMDFRSGSPSDNSGAEEMEVALARPRHRVVSPSPPLQGLGSLSALGPHPFCLSPWVLPCGQYSLTVRSEMGH